MSCYSCYYLIFFLFVIIACFEMVQTSIDGRLKPHNFSYYYLKRKVIGGQYGARAEMIRSKIRISLKFLDFSLLTWVAMQFRNNRRRKKSLFFFFSLHFSFSFFFLFCCSSLLTIAYNQTHAACIRCASAMVKAFSFFLLHLFSHLYFFISCCCCFFFFTEVSRVPS